MAEGEVVTEPIRVNVLRCNHGVALFDQEPCGRPWEECVCIPVAEWEAMRAELEALRQEVKGMDRSCPDDWYD